jgi:hypothetical protein
MPSKSKPKKKRAAPPPAAGYSRRSLREKLGMKEGTSAAVIEAPADYASLVGTDQFDTELDLDAYDFLHFFTPSSLALQHIFPVLAGRLKKDGALWISWPKQSSKMPTDLSENDVRAIGLATGLVDVKVCAIDSTWSGLKFVYRVKDR